jgi:hypothetical protein
MRAGPRIVEAGLWLVAVACAFWATLWVLGANGFDRLRYDSVPRWLDPLSLYGANAQWVSRPSPSIRLAGTDQHRVSDLYAQLSSLPVPALHTFPANYASLVPEDHVFLQGITTTQRLSYLALHLAVYVVVALIAVALARLVATSVAETPFIARNARTLQVIGLVLVIGAPLASVAEWATLRWMVTSSSVSDRVSFGDYELSSLPLWTMLVGAGVMVLADVWKRGVQMADDVRGLV